MKKYIIILISLVCNMLAAVTVQNYSTCGSTLQAYFTGLRESPLINQAEDVNIDESNNTSSVITKTLAFPYAEAELNITSMKWNVYNAQGTYLYSEEKQIDSAIGIVQSFTFREMQGYTIKIETQLQENGLIRTLNELNFELLGSDPISLPETVSPAFIDAYRALADNFEYSYLRDLPLARPKILIITHSQLANYQTSFISWKKSLGYDVYTVNKSDIGSTVQDIKNYVLNHYQTYKCDYLFIWGDVTGTFAVPTNFFPSPEYAENDADDTYYTMLQGNDYFPEMISGRFSFADASEFITMTNKTIAYEKAPFMTNTTWMTRALTVAGNYAEGGLRPSTPISMSRWLRDKMLSYGYTQVDTVFYPPSYPGTNNIQQSINQGVQFISYRGWGDANGWHYPSFHIPDLNNTFNGAKMPIVYSIVCNTGDFANTVNPNFGEKWMRMGTMSNPIGCIAFVGPSDLHTKTRLNNSISSGAFRSILDFGVRSFGSSVLMGKIELYKTFPNDLAPNQYVAFYYHVYNILSDPSLNMWVLVPSLIPESVIESGFTYNQSTSHLRINAPNLNGGIVSGTKDGNTYNYAPIKNGYAILPVDPNSVGDLTVTISKKNFVPLVKTFTSQQNATIGVVANNLSDTILAPDTSYTLSLELKNFATLAYNNVNANLSCNHSAIIISNPNALIASLNPDATTFVEFNFTTTGAFIPGENIDFTLTLDNPSTTHIFQLMTGGAKIQLINYEGILQIGQANNINFTVSNIGNYTMNDIELQIRSLSTAAVAQSAPISIGSLAPNESRQFNATITLQSDVTPGHNIPVRIDASNDTDYTYYSYYALTAGTPGTDDPTGPDEYGYYAYDSTDLGYEQTPVYNWIELDPDSGTLLGDVFLSPDDSVKTVPLPFSFRFYGVDYDSVTMCTNGWISFIPTSLSDFYNCYIPAALGPYTMVAGYWDDLKGMKTGTDNEGNPIFDNMRLIYWFDSANNRYIIEWNKAYNQYTIDLGPDASMEKFQIILYPKPDQDGDIVIQYHTVDNPGITTNYCTVGIEDQYQMRGLTYTHGNTYPITAATLAPSLAIKFTTSKPDNYVANEDDVMQSPISDLYNYPNPFNPVTSIYFNAKQAGQAKLNIYNLKGQLIRSLLNENIVAGQHKVVWDGMDNKGTIVGSGLYLYKLQMNGYTNTKKMLLLK
ncbi:MAG: C25 family cysteine peptidase [Candidatus Cloacimonas sp.]